MDTSKEYILQCEKAEEIQEIREERGSFLAGRYGLYIRLGFDKRAKMAEHISNFDFDTKLKSYIWLPQQDQLQGILFSQETVEACFYRDIHSLAKDFYLFAFKHPEFTSMEQLWLAFVMKEKYHKTWNGKDWVK